MIESGAETVSIADKIHVAGVDIKRTSIFKHQGLYWQGPGKNGSAGEDLSGQWHPRSLS